MPGKQSAEKLCRCTSFFLSNKNGKSTCLRYYISKKIFKYPWSLNSATESLSAETTIAERLPYHYRDSKKKNPEKFI